MRNSNSYVGPLHTVRSKHAGPDRGTAAAATSPLRPNNYINIFHYRNNRVSQRPSPLLVIPGKP